jgi:S1-C subfamily serine protease
MKSALRFRILLASLMVLGLAVACALPAAVLPTPTPVPTIPPTATPAPPVLPTVPPEAFNALEAQVEAVYAQAAPAVVNITTRSIAYDIFMQPIPQEGTGSGFLYDDQGHIVTNYHVVENAESVVVTLSDGRSFPADIVGVDPSSDLAVIRIPAENLPAPLPLADSGQLRVGQFVIAIGSPFGQVGTMTLGVISALERVIQSPDGRFIGEAIQTDAAINPGNSGGPPAGPAGAGHRRELPDYQPPARPRRASGLPFPPTRCGGWCRISSPRDGIPTPGWACRSSP